MPPDSVTSDRSYDVTYAITSLMDNHATTLAAATIPIRAATSKAAAALARAWVEDNDYHFDPRVDPRCTITDVTERNQVSPRPLARELHAPHTPAQ